MLKFKYLCIALFPIAFYLIQLTEFGSYVAPISVLQCFCIISLCIWIGYFSISKFAIKNQDATIITYFFVLIVYFFFGSIKNGLQSNVSLQFLASYKFFLPLLSLMFYGIYFLAKKRPIITRAILQYCNSLTIIIIALQLVFISQNYFKARNKVPITHSLKYSKPNGINKENMYFILLDEYAGNISLENYFQYSNTNFSNKLRSIGFHVIDSCNSNYNFTFNSLSSTLNMQYLNLEALKPFNKYNAMYLGSFASIRENNLCKFLANNGYSIKNNSIFEISTSTRYTKIFFSGSALQLIHAPMLQNVLWFEIYCKLTSGTFKNDWFNNKFNVYKYYNSNQQGIQNLIKLSKSSKKPQFVYTHLLLPHMPYFLDSTGELLVYKQHTAATQDSLYLQNLIGTNKQIAKLVDTLIKNDPKAIIIIMSDHGYRQYKQNNSPYVFNNFIAIKTPDSNSINISGVKSNVNVFRLILNQYFGQNLTLLPDSSFFYDSQKQTFNNYNFSNQQ